jgi:hypothetical protein
MSDKPSVEERLAAFFAQTDEPEREPAVAAAPAPAPEPEPELPAEPVAQVEGADVVADTEPATELPQDLEELAAAWNVDVARLYDIKVPITDADGKPVKVKLGEWKDGYQESAKLQALRQAEQARLQAVQEAQNQRLAVIHQRAVEMDAVVKNAEERLLSRAAAINWNALREADPAEWTAKRVELQEEAAQIQKLKADAMQHAQAAFAQQAQQQEQAFEQVKAYHRDLVRTLVPDFADPEKGMAKGKALMQHMLALGFTEADTKQVWDARLVKLLDDSYTLQQLRTSKAVADKKVETAPKRFVKPGVPRAANAGAQASYKQARTQLRKSGKLEDAIKLFNIR